jgi:ABC-type lipoprotein export system ATPase subunit
LILLQLTEDQRAAVEAPFDECVAIVGAAGTGKSTALAERIARASRLDPGAEPLVFTAESQLEALAAEILR